MPNNFSHGPILGTVIEGNTFIDALGGGVIQVAPSANSFTGAGFFSPSALRTYLTISVALNNWIWDSSFGTYSSGYANQYPSSSGGGYPNPVIGSNPQNNGQNGTPFAFPLLMTLTVGDYGSQLVNTNNNPTLMPEYWELSSSSLVGNTGPLYEGPNGFIDPEQLVASIEGNTYQLLNPTQTDSVIHSNSGPLTVPTMKIVGGIVNIQTYGVVNTNNNSAGFTSDTTTIPQAGTSSGVQAVTVGQDGHDLLGQTFTTLGGSSVDVPSTPDQLTDLHVVLTGLPTNKTIKQVVIAPYGGGGNIEYDQTAPSSSGYDGNIQAILQQATGATTADLYFEPYVYANDFPASRNDIGYNSPVGPDQDVYNITITYTDNSQAPPLSVSAVMFDPGNMVAAPWPTQDPTPVDVGDNHKSTVGVIDPTTGNTFFGVVASNRGQLGERALSCRWRARDDGPRRWRHCGAGQLRRARLYRIRCVRSDQR